MTSFLRSDKKEAVNLSYLEKYGHKNKYHIPTCFGKFNYQRGHQFKARIVNIYDPSKFWIVTKCEELQAFQKYLFKTYYIDHRNYKVPIEKLEINQYCVVLVDNSYYRGIIVGFCQLMDTPSSVQIFYIDCGMIGTVNADCIYYMMEVLFEVPQFTIRASLAGVRPHSNTEWTSYDVQKFSELCLNKLLVGTVVNVDPIGEILDVQLGEYTNESLVLVHEVLIELGIARYFSESEEETEYSYLFPTHAALESGKFPFSVSDLEYQKSLFWTPDHSAIQTVKEDMEENKIEKNSDSDVTIT